MSGGSSAQLEKWMTTKEVAEVFDVPTRTVLRMIREGRLKAEKIGWQWLIDKRNLPQDWPPPVNHNR